MIRAGRPRVKSLGREVELGGRVAVGFRGGVQAAAEVGVEGELDAAALEDSQGAEVADAVAEVELDGAELGQTGDGGKVDDAIALAQREDLEVAESGERAEVVHVAAVGEMKGAEVGETAEKSEVSRMAAPAKGEGFEAGQAVEAAQAAAVQVALEAQGAQVGQGGEGCEVGRLRAGEPELAEAAQLRQWSQVVHLGVEADAQRGELGHRRQVPQGGEARAGGQVKDPQ